jgi:hypothetical protein
MAKIQAVTSIPRSPDDDRNSRMIRYAIGWGIRLVCLISLLFLHGWWLVAPAIVAIGAPMVLVILANAVGSSRQKVERPGAIVRSADVKQ